MQKKKERYEEEREAEKEWGRERERENKRGRESKGEIKKACFSSHAVFICVITKETISLPLWDHRL